MYVKKGDPVKDFATPVNWVRIPLKMGAGSGMGDLSTSTSALGAGSAAQTTYDTWHTAYHGSRPAFVRKILDHGELVPLGNNLTKV